MIADNGIIEKKVERFFLEFVERKRDMDLEKMLENSEALLKGHFLLSSGLHSDAYIQCARLLQNTSYAQIVGKELATKLEKFSPDCVISPAIGGIVIGYEVARNLEVPFIFAERGGDGKMTLRRGFDPSSFKRIVVVEDVVTTGKSTREVIRTIKKYKATVVATSAIVNRKPVNDIEGLPFTSLASIPLKLYKPTECPLCKEDIPLVKPGTRKEF